MPAHPKNRLVALLARHHVRVLEDLRGGLTVPPESLGPLLYALREAPPAKGTPEHTALVRMLTGSSEPVDPLFG